MDSPLKQLDWFKEIVALDNRQFQQKLDKAEQCQLVALLLVVYNIYTGKVPVSGKDRRSFKTSKPFLKRLLTKKIGLKTRKNLIKSRTRLVKKLLAIFLSHE